jgi:hypothetical protein
MQPRLGEWSEIRMIPEVGDSEGRERIYHRGHGAWRREVAERLSDWRTGYCAD